MSYIILSQGMKLSFGPVICIGFFILADSGKTTRDNNASGLLSSRPSSRHSYILSCHRIICPFSLAWKGNSGLETYSCESTLSLIDEEIETPTGFLGHDSPLHHSFLLLESNVALQTHGRTHYTARPQDASRLDHPAVPVPYLGKSSE